MRHPLFILLSILLFPYAGPSSAGWEEGVAAIRSGDHGRAVQEFASVVEARPDFAAGHFMLARAHSNLGGTAEALKHYRTAYELDSGNVSYQFELARAYLANDRAGDAARILQQIDPSSLPSAQQAEYQQMLGNAGDGHPSSDERPRGGEIDPRIEEEHRRIAEENRRIEEENAEIEAMEREREALEQELKELEGGEPPN